MSNSEYTSSDISDISNIDLSGDIMNNYNIIIELGRGSYSIVWLVFCIKDSKFYAMKVQNPEDFDEGVQEINILKRIPSDEQYINRLIDYFIETRYDDEMNEIKYMCSVYNLCCGNLDGMIRKGNFKNGYDIKTVKKIFKQVCIGLQTIHTKLNGFHGDIKPDNILLCGVNNRDKVYIELYKKADYNKLYNEAKKIYMIENNIKKISNENKLSIRKTIHKKIIDYMPSIDDSSYSCDKKYIDNPTIKISDFGFFCHDKEQFNESFGTCYYMAPENILKGDCTNMIDVWSLGCMLYELLTAEILFNPSDESTDSHLEMIIELCGEFDIGYLKTTEHYTKYFDKNGLLLNTKNKFNKSDKSDNTINNIYNKLKEHKINDINLANLLEKMLRLTPTKRYTLKELLNHKWLN